MHRVGAGAFAVRMLVGTVAVFCGFVLAGALAGALYAAQCDPGVVDEFTARGNFTKLKVNRCNWVDPLRALIDELANRVGLLTSSNAWTNTNDFSNGQIKLPTASPCNPLLCDDASEYNTVCVDNTDPANPAQYLCGSSGWVLSSGSGMFFNVQSYGAVGDGSTDDTTAIQAASTAAAGNGTVYLPCGTYKITAPLELDYTNAHWLGEGDCTTIRQFTTAAHGIIQNSSISATIYNVLLQDFRLDCDASATSCGTGVYLESVSDSEFRNLYVDVYPSGSAGFTTGLRIHSTSNEATRNLFYDLGVRTFANASSIGVHLTGASPYGPNSTRFFGGHIRADLGIGLLIPPGLTDQVVVSGMVFEGSTDQAVSIGGSGSGSSGHLIEGCRFEGVAKGILFGATAVGNMAIGNLYTSGVTPAYSDLGDRNVKIEATASGGTGTASAIQMSHGDILLDNGKYIGRGAGQVFQTRNSSSCTSGKWFVKETGQWGLGDCAGSEDILFQRSATGVMQLQTGSFAANNGLYTGASTLTPRLVSGSGSPEGVVAAVVGSVFQGDGSGGAAVLWTKTGGSGTTGWTAVSIVGSAADTLLASQPAGAKWMVSGHSKNQLYGINKRSDVTITGNTGTIAITNATAPFSGEEEGDESPITITTAATDTAILVASVTPRNTTCTASGLPDACCTGSGTGTCNLPTDHLSLIAGFYVSAQFYGTGFAYPQSITVEGQYDDGAGATTWRTIASTTTNTSTFFMLNANNPSSVDPHKIYTLRWTFTNWTATGTTYLISAGMHHRSERAFPPYLARDGDTAMPMLGPVRWARYLGTISHLEGPPDQNLKMEPASGKTMDVTAPVTPGRLTTAERDALVSVADGTFIYNTDVQSLQYKKAGVWVSF